MRSITMSFKGSKASRINKKWAKIILIKHIDRLFEENKDLDISIYPDDAICFIK